MLDRFLFTGTKRTVHLSGWKAFSQSCSHFAAASRSLCSLRQSFFDLIGMYVILLSANNRSLLCLR